jgi:hypothetical protein
MYVYVHRPYMYIGLHMYIWRRGPAPTVILKKNTCINGNFLSLFRSDAVDTTIAQRRNPFEDFSGWVHNVERTRPNGKHLISVTLNTGPEGQHVILCGFDPFLYTYYRFFENKFIAVKCDGPYRIKAHPPVKLVGATFLRCRDIYQSTSIAQCIDEICRPQFISVKGYVMMSREDMIPDGRGLAEVFLHQEKNIDSPRISIFVPICRKPEVRFRGQCNLFSEVLFDPNYGRNTRLQDSGAITVVAPPEPVAGPSLGVKRKRPADIQIYTNKDRREDSDDDDDDAASPSLIIAPEPMSQVIDVGGNSPRYSPSNATQDDFDFDMYPPPRKIIKKSGFFSK